MSLVQKYPQEVERILAKYPPEGRRSAVMPLLFLAQREASYLDKAAMQDVADIVDTLIPVSGRALPGYEPGLLAMQKHAVAAAHRALTTPDAGWDGAIPKATILAAEMGTGKTSMGIAVAEVLRQLAPTNR